MTERRWINRWLIVLGVVSSVIGEPIDVQSERFLTREEAFEICFPKAESRSEVVLEYDKHEKRAIRKRSGVRVKKDRNRMWQAKRGDRLLGSLIFDRVIGKHKFIDYAVAITPDGKVKQIEILVYREHYGGEIRREAWREQFVGKSASSKLKITKDISNISGATLSAMHVTEGVRRVLATFDVVVEPKLADSGSSHRSVSN